MIRSLHTFDTYKRIIDLEERRGRLKEYIFSKEVRDLSANLKELRKKYKQAGKKDKKLLEKQLSEERSRYEEKRISEIQQLTEKILTRSFSICLRKVSTNGNKTGYTTANVESMLLSKVLMLELKKSYKCVPANRNNIIEELSALLDNPMSKIIIRADFHEFFESIPQDGVIAKIVKDSRISSLSIKCLKTFIYKYNELSGNLKTKKGVPRGISFSSYLAEIYLAEFDRRVRQIEGIYFYKRYVDDIIILANPAKQDKDSLWKQLVLEVDNMGLSLSDKENKKTCVLYTSEYGNPVVLNYLGYQYRFVDGKLDVLLTEDKFNRYKKCIELTFEKYKEIGSFTSRRNVPKGNREDTTIQFMHRLNALTCNGHLNGRKNYVLVGVYYSNKYLTSIEQLRLLDEYIRECLDNPDIFNPKRTMFNYDNENNYQGNVTSIREKILNNYSFSKGFLNRCHYRWNDYSLIMRQIGNLYNSQENNE